MKSDKEIIKNLIRGDIITFDEVYKKYHKKIYSIALSYLKSKEDAEGVVQEVYLNLWRKRAGLKEKYNFDSYLFTIAYNTIKKRFSKLSREREIQKDYVRSIPLIEDSANTETEYKNLLEHANSVINRLPERQRTVYHLSIREGLSIEEISVKLGISKRTIENHLYRAKTLLKKALSDNRLSSILFICLFIQ